MQEGNDAAHQRSLGFLEVELNNFLCDGKEFRDLSYCSNKKYLAGLPPTDPSGRNIGYFQANVGTMAWRRECLQRMLSATC